MFRHRSRQTPKRPSARPQVEALEGRCLPAVMSYLVPTSSAHVLTLQLIANKLTLYDNGVQKDQQSLTNLSVSITGAGGDDTLVLNYSTGLFTVPITFNGGAGSGDTIQVSLDANFTLSNTLLSSSQGSSVNLIGGSVEKANLTGGAGANTL